MKITFLGTGAANGYPEAFCRCDNCERARALGGPSLRRRSAALVNDDLLIDLGPDVPVAAAVLGCALTNVRYCLQTHAHSDHLDPTLLMSRSPEWGVVGAHTLQFYASAASLQRAAEALARDCAPGSLLDADVAERMNVRFHAVEAFVPFQVGPYHVTPVRANHDPGVEPVLYVVEDDAYCLFYATDTAALSEASWLALRGVGRPFDMVVMDHTYGWGEPAQDHLGAEGFVAHVARMRRDGLLAEGARVLATHISHPRNPPHPELSAQAARHGYEIAHDGLVVTAAH